jgi:hypothetical protein
MLEHGDEKAVLLSFLGALCVSARDKDYVLIDNS